MHRKADLIQDIDKTERERVERSTVPIQNQVNEPLDVPPASMVVKPTRAMDECIRVIRYGLLPGLTSGDFQMSGEMSALYSSLIRCITEFEHSEHAIRSLITLSYDERDFQAVNQQVFGLAINRELNKHDHMRMESFREMTHVLSEMSQIRSVRELGVDKWFVQLVDRCEYALGNDTSEYGL